jgi:hypothetical protein
MVSAGTSVLPHDPVTSDIGLSFLYVLLRVVLETVLAGVVAVGARAFCVGVLAAGAGLVTGVALVGDVCGAACAVAGLLLALAAAVIWLIIAC